MGAGRHLFIKTLDTNLPDPLSEMKNKTKLNLLTKLPISPVNTQQKYTQLSFMKLISLDMYHSRKNLGNTNLLQSHSFLCALLFKVKVGIKPFFYCQSPSSCSTFKLSLPICLGSDSRAYNIQQEIKDLK